MAIYQTEGYDESLVGTLDQIVNHIADQTGMHVSSIKYDNGYIVFASESNENQSDVDIYQDATYTVNLTPTTVLGE